MQSSKVIEGVGETGVTAHRPGHSGICSLPTSLSTLKRVPSACLVLGIHTVLQGMSLPAHPSHSCLVVPPGLTGRWRFGFRQRADPFVWRHAGILRARATLTLGYPRYRVQ